MNLRQRIARRLRFLADRIDHGGSMMDSGMSFTFEQGFNLRVRTDGRGCPMWYCNADYDLAQNE